MYRQDPLLTTPPDYTKLWRYLDLSLFVWFLSSRSLYFAPLIEFADKWEGALPAGSTEALKLLTRSIIDSPSVFSRPGESEESVYTRIKYSHKYLQQFFRISCWHKNEVESIAMWKLYTNGKDGVAIQTTVGRLKASLSVDTRPMFIAEVRYGHEPKTGEQTVSSTALLPALTKRKSFEHESEVRVILDTGRGSSDDWGGRVYADPRFLDAPKGEAIRVDADTLIERIIASPDYPAWALSSLQEQITDAGLRVQVEISDLLKMPQAE